MDKTTQYTGMIELLRYKTFCTRSKYSVRRPVQRLLKFSKLSASSATSTPPVDLEHNEQRRNSDCAEIQGEIITVLRHSTSVRVFVCFEVKLFQDLNATVVFPLGTRTVTSDVELEETANHIQRDRGL